MGNMLFGPSAEEMEAKRKNLQKNVKMDEHMLPWEELCERLDATNDADKGLTEKQAAEHLLKYGKNELTPPPTTPWYVKFFNEMTGFFSLLLWLAGIACFVSYSLIPDQENLILGIVLVVVVWFTGCFSYYQNQKSDNMMAEFKAMKPPKVMVVRDGTKKQIDSEKVTVGDIVMLNQGDLVPADCRVISCSPNMAVDNSSLTGEPDALKRKPDPDTDPNVMEAKNMCFFGTQVPEGSATTMVVKVADETVIGRIAILALSTEAEQTPINKEIEHFIHIISAIAIALGVSFFAVLLAYEYDPVISLVFMIGIIVANVPEGLLTTVTVCLTLTAKRMHTKQVLVKKLEGVETLGSTSCICSDKTGTLTQNIMTVAQLVYADDDDDLKIQDAASSFTKGVRTYDPQNGAFHELLKCSTLCNTCVFEKYIDHPTIEGKRVLRPFKKTRTQGDGSTIEEILWQPIGNASEGAMIKFAHPALNESLGITDIEKLRKSNAKVFDIPFNSKNKYQVHVHCQSDNADTDTNDRMMYMKGAPERILMRCTTYQTPSGKLAPITDEIRAKIEAKQEQMGNNGLRVLGFAQTVLPYAKFGKDFEYSDGRPDYSTANFPLGEFAQIAKYEAAKKAGTPLMEGKMEMKPPHPDSAPGLTFLGMMALIDPPREAVPGAVSKCKTAGIKVIMVTGDHPGTAKAIAYKVGILWSECVDDIEKANALNKLSPGDPGFVDPDTAQGIVVPGWELEDDTPISKWNQILSHPQIVFARTSPQQKLVIVGHCQRMGHIVAVTGDGVNDSPALKKADIGIAMGIAGTPVTKNAADMILLDDNFASIVAGVEEGRLIFDNLKKSICYTLTSNIPEISPFLCFVLFNTPLPLSTVLILAIDLGTDMVPAISMAYEEAEADIMKRPPRNAKTDRLVTRKLIFLAYLQIGVMQAMAGFYAWMVVLNDYGFPPNILLGNPTGGYFSEYTMYCKFHGGQYVNADGEIDPNTDPQTAPPTRDYPLWDRGDGGYLKKCTFPLKMYKGGRKVPNRDFKYKNAETYPQGTAGRPQETIENVWALEARGFYSYIPWRSVASPFWRKKWLNWNIKRQETTSTPAFGWKGKLDGEFTFVRQLPGVYSVCLANGGDLSGLKRKNTFKIYEGMIDAGNRFDLSKDVWRNGKTTPEMYPFNNFENGACIGRLNAKKAYKEATFCNGAYHADGNSTGGPGCEALDHVTQNLRYCKGGCGNCEDVYGAARANTEDTPKGESVQQCQNIASRMTQMMALAHARAAYWVSIVVVQWADLLICKTRWLSIRQQGLRNSVLNFGLFFETLLAAWLCYGGRGIQDGLGTQPLRFTHWMPGIPWSIMIFMYDETRKYLMRATSPEVVDPMTGQVKRVKGWIEKATYY